MAFIVEDGSAQPGATSFASLDFFRAYCTDRGYTDAVAWPDATIQINLVKATSFLHAKYTMRFSGFRQTQAQSLCWPRMQARRKDSAEGTGWGGVWTFDYFVPMSTVPNEVMAAVCELAISVAGLTDATTQNTNQLAPDILTEDYNTLEEKTGPIETKYRNERSLPYNVWRMPDMILSPLLVAGGSNPRLVRS